MKLIFTFIFILIIIFNTYAQAEIKDSITDSIKIFSKGISKKTQLILTTTIISSNSLKLDINFEITNITNCDKIYGHNIYRSKISYTPNIKSESLKKAYDSLNKVFDSLKHCTSKLKIEYETLRNCQSTLDSLILIKVDTLKQGDTISQDYTLKLKTIHNSLLGLRKNDSITYSNIDRINRDYDIQITKRDSLVNVIKNPKDYNNIKSKHRWKQKYKIRKNILLTLNIDKKNYSNYREINRFVRRHLHKAFRLLDSNEELFNNLLMTKNKI